MYKRQGQGKGLAVIAVLIGLNVPAHAGDDRLLYASLGEATRAPIGWVEFCAEAPGECRGGATQPRDIVMSQTAWRDLLRVNHWVNETIKPLTDMEDVYKRQREAQHRRQTPHHGFHASPLVLRLCMHGAGTFTSSPSLTADSVTAR